MNNSQPTEIKNLAKQVAVTIETVVTEPPYGHLIGFGQIMYSRVLKFDTLDGTLPELRRAERHTSPLEIYGALFGAGADTVLLSCGTYRKIADVAKPSENNSAYSDIHRDLKYEIVK